MLTKTIIAASALLSMAAAVPLQQHNKRDVVWETRTQWDVTTIDVTTTVWLAPGETAPTGAAAPAAATTHFGHNHKKPRPSPAQPSPSPSPASPPAYSPSPSPPEQSAPPATTPTSVYSPSPVASSPPAPTSSSGGLPSSGSPSGQTYTGDITHYDVGLGSCGYTNTDSEAVVALPIGMMNNPANPNANPLCGKTITIEYAGQTHTAEIVDTCGGCEGESIDLSPTLFTAVAPNGNGRVHGVNWWYNN